MPAWSLSTTRSSITKDCCATSKVQTFRTSGELLTSKPKLEVYDRARDAEAAGDVPHRKPGGPSGRSADHRQLDPVRGGARSAIMEKIGELFEEKKLPMVVDCRDESTHRRADCD